MKKLFELTQTGGWLTAGIDTQYKIHVEDDALVLVFQESSSKWDWLFNFAGVCIPWRLAKKEIDLIVRGNLRKRKLVITGFSHGGMLAKYAHRHFADLFPHTVAFGSARDFFLPSKLTRYRYSCYTRVEAKGDIVTYLLPWFSKVGTVIKIGDDMRIGTEAHYASNYRRGLEYEL